MTTTATDMAMITDAPITREEVLMLFTGSVKAQEEIVKTVLQETKNYFENELKQHTIALTKIVDRNESIAAKIEAALSNAGDNAKLIGLANEQLKATREMRNVISNMDSHIHPKMLDDHETTIVRPILDKSSLKAWKQDVWNVLNAIAPKYGVGAPMVCSYVYQKMKSKYGVDVNILFENRKNRDRDTSKMLMCMHDARLGQQFEDALLDLYCEAMTKETPGNKKSVVPESIVVRLIPDNLKSVCRELYPELSDIMALNRIYFKMEQISGLNIANYIKANKSKIRYSKFGKAYFVSKDKKLMSIFNRAVKELKEG